MPVPPAVQTPRLRELSDGVAAYVQPDGSWMINNAGAVTDGTEMMLIDTTATERRTRQLLQAVSDWSGAAPVTTIVNTHYHGDHTFGNCMVPGATVVAHEFTRSEIVRNGLNLTSAFPYLDFGAITVCPPSMTLTDEIVLHRFGRQIVVRHVGEAAHTAGDVIVWLPAERILFTGDVVFAGAHPFAVDGDLAGLARVCRRLAALDPLVVVPGHGDVGDAGLLHSTASYCDFIVSLAARTDLTGTDLVELAHDVAAMAEFEPFRHWREPERLVVNLAVARPPGAAGHAVPLDPKSAGALMTRYLGHSPRSAA